MLCSWLSNNPNYEEITKWYLGWKGMLSEQLISHPVIKEKLNEALDIMNRAVASGLGQFALFFPLTHAHLLLTKVLYMTVKPPTPAVFWGVQRSYAVFIHINHLG